jgi:ParB-like chromosome segregation protein Spo0J
MTRTLASLRPWERNYNVGNIAAIVESIRRFGFNSALATYGDEVMVGNHRFLALTEMKANGEPAPNGVMELGPNWLVPTFPLDHLSPDEATAYAIADNKTAAMATPDETKLAELIAELDAVGLAEATSYSVSEIDKMILELEDASSVTVPAEVETTAPTPILKWEKHQCPMTADESNALTLRYEMFIERHGTPYGFVGSLGL